MVLAGIRSFDAVVVAVVSEEQRSPSASLDAQHSALLAEAGNPNSARCRTLRQRLSRWLFGPSMDESIKGIIAAGEANANVLREIAAEQRAFNARLQERLDELERLRAANEAKP